jgi:hypothetical protein
MKQEFKNKLISDIEKKNIKDSYDNYIVQLKMKLDKL